MRLPALEPGQDDVARAWVKIVAEWTERLNSGSTGNDRVDIKHILTLKENMEIGWTVDEKWDDMLRLDHALEVAKSKL